MSKISPSEIEPKASLRQTLTTARSLLPYLKPHHGRLAVAAGFLLLMAFLTLAEPRVLGWIVDKGLVPRSMNWLVGLTIAFGIIQILRAATQAWQSRAFALLGQAVMDDLRKSAWRRLMGIPMPVYHSQPVGKLVTRVTNDSATLSEMFSEGMISVLGNVLVCLGTLVSLFWLNWKLSLLCLGTFPVLVVFALAFSRQLNMAYKTARLRLSELNANLAETLQGMKEVFLAGREQTQQKKFDELNLAYTEAQFASTKVFAVFQPTITLCTGLSMGIAIYFGGQMVASKTLAVGDLVAYLAYVLGLFQPVREIADKWNLFLSGMSAGERILDVLNWKVEDDSNVLLTSEPSSIPKFEGRIRFDKVWFSYHDENWVLRDVSFEVAPGELVGIAGPSGAGKTTLIQLLMRFYEPQKGTIWIDGRDLKTIPRHEVRAALGFVQQDLFLFSGSIAENLELWEEGRLDREESRPIKIWLEGLAASGRLPNLVGGFSTNVVERGQNLSMGERQILAFARAGLKRPSIWILDEATASVDSSTEGELTKLLESTCAGRSTLVVAHRLATIQKAHKILVFHKGNLIESGNHRQLVEREGLYSKLWKAEEAALWPQSSQQPVIPAHPSA